MKNAKKGAFTTEEINNTEEALQSLKGQEQMTQAEANRQLSIIHRTIDEIKEHVVKQQKDLEHSAVNVGRIVAMRAESMVSDMDDARSEVSSSVAASSVAPRYAHSSVESARRGLRAA